MLTLGKRCWKLAARNQCIVGILTVVVEQYSDIGDECFRGFYLFTLITVTLVKSKGRYVLDTGLIIC